MVRYWDYQMIVARDAIYNYVWWVIIFIEFQLFLFSSCLCYRICPLLRNISTAPFLFYCHFIYLRLDITYHLFILSPSPLHIQVQFLMLSCPFQPIDHAYPRRMSLRWFSNHNLRATIQIRSYAYRRMGFSKTSN